MEVIMILYFGLGIFDHTDRTVHRKKAVEVGKTMDLAVVAVSLSPIRELKLGIGARPGNDINGYSSTISSLRPGV